MQPLPDGLSRSGELTATYIVVLFAVIVQGGTIAWLIERLRPRAAINKGHSEAPAAPTA